MGAFLNTARPLKSNTRWQLPRGCSNVLRFQTPRPGNVLAERGREQQRPRDGPPPRGAGGGPGAAGGRAPAALRGGGGFTSKGEDAVMLSPPRGLRAAPPRCSAPRGAPVGSAALGPR